MEFDAFARHLAGDDGVPDLTLETVLTHKDWMGLTTATPLQRAVCRIADGLPIDDLLEMPLVANLEAYPEEVQERATWEWSIHGYTPGNLYREIAIPSAIRGAKSLMSIARGVQMSQLADLSALMDGEIARFGIVSLSIDNAKATFEKLTAAYDYSPRIRELAVERPTTDKMLLKHPSGRIVEIKVLAGKRAGGSLVSRWLIGAVFDEATRMLSEEEGVVNVEASRKASIERLLPGCQLWYPGSPWAPMGLVYDMVQDALKGELADDAVVIRAIGPALNPTHWDPARLNRLSTSKNQDDQEVMMTDGLAEFADITTGWILAEALAAVTRTTQLYLPPEAGLHYVAVMDPATKSNAWTLSIAALCRDGIRRQFLAREWVPRSAMPLNSSEVFREIANECRVFGVQSVVTDQWADTLLQERALEVGLTLDVQPASGPGNVREMSVLRKLITERACELAGVEHLVDDIKRARRKLTQNGVSLVLPVTSDGRHCDYVPVTARSVSMAIYEPEPLEEPLPPEMNNWLPSEVADFESLHESEVDPLGGEVFDL